MLKKTAETILDEPIVLTVDIKPQSKFHSLLQRLRIKPKKINYSIHGTTLRNMLRISKLLIDINLKPIPDNGVTEWSYNILITESERMAEIIAIAIHNSRSERPRSLINLIMDNFTASELKGVTSLVLDRLNVADFINSIASVRTMNLLSQASPQGPEIIAEPEIFTQQSEELKNIFVGAQII